MQACTVGTQDFLCCPRRVPSENELALTTTVHLIRRTHDEPQPLPDALRQIWLSPQEAPPGNRSVLATLVTVQWKPHPGEFVANTAKNLVQLKLRELGSINRFEARGLPQSGHYGRLLDSSDVQAQGALVGYPSAQLAGQHVPGVLGGHAPEAHPRGVLARWVLPKCPVRTESARLSVKKVPHPELDGAGNRLSAAHMVQKCSPKPDIT